MDEMKTQHENIRPMRTLVPAVYCIKGHRAAIGHFEVLNYDGKYCAECGAEVLEKCPTCGEDILCGPDGKGDFKRPQFCVKCGTEFPWKKRKREGTSRE